MKLYRSKGFEFIRESFTHLFIVTTLSPATTVGGSTTNDFSVGFNNQQVALTTLQTGDVVMEGMLEVRTQVAGPTVSPTGQLKINTANIAITPTLVLTNTASTIVTQSNNSVVGSGSVQTGTDTLVLDLQAGGGNGAAATAGEVWCWARITRLADRTIQA